MIVNEKEFYGVSRFSSEDDYSDEIKTPAESNKLAKKLGFEQAPNELDIGDLKYEDYTVLRYSKDNPEEVLIVKIFPANSRVDNNPTSQNSYDLVSECKHYY